MSVVRFRRRRVSAARFWGTGLYVASTQLLDGRYRLVERLGGGATAVVWRAQDEVLGRRVAVKVLSAEFAADAQFRARIRAEAQAAASLNHPHVTNVHDYGESAIDGEPVPYVVMELLAGPTLAEVMRSGPLPVGTALRIGMQVAQALAAAHARGLVHCDIKPANIVMTRRGAKVVDFGISGVAGQRDPHALDGQIWGTPAYIAPERLAGGEAVAATDVYALGIMLYQALSGTSPWQAASTMQMLIAHAGEEPAPLPPIDGLPPTVASLCSRCLAKDPLERPSAAWVARELREARNELKAAAVPVAKPSSPRRRGRTKPVVQALIVLLAALIAGYCGFAGPGPEAPGAAPPPAGPGGSPTTGRDVESDTPTSPPGATGRGGPSGPSGVGTAPTAGGALPGNRPGGTGGPGGGSGPGGATPTQPGGGSTGNGSGSQPRPVDRTITTVGGSVVARCVGSTASILSTSPLTGFAVSNLDRGPGSGVGVTFRAVLTTVRVVIRCASGVPTPSIQVG